MRGHWRYLEHDWVAKPGTFIYEPAGEAHTLVITDDSPEPALILFIVEGGLIYLDKGVNGGFAAYEDGFTLLELTRKYPSYSCRPQGGGTCDRYGIRSGGQRRWCGGWARRIDRGEADVGLERIGPRRGPVDNIRAGA